mmetsp:Transcript_38817/g.92794  ORF Transcript_38817/g.92794 Transcript_38817/m.92794 type:complete len:692 (-) Transcript_38817:2668-4743(-)
MLWIRALQPVSSSWSLSDSDGTDHATQPKRLSSWPKIAESLNRARPRAELRGPNSGGPGHGYPAIRLPTGSRADVMERHKHGLRAAVTFLGLGQPPKLRFATASFHKVPGTRILWTASTTASVGVTTGLDEPASSWGPSAWHLGAASSLDPVWRCRRVEAEFTAEAHVCAGVTDGIFHCEEGGTTQKHGWLARGLGAHHRSSGVLAGKELHGESHRNVLAAGNFVFPSTTVDEPTVWSPALLLQKAEAQGLDHAALNLADVHGRIQALATIVDNVEGPDLGLAGQNIDLHLGTTCAEQVIVRQRLLRDTRLTLLVEGRTCFECIADDLGPRFAGGGVGRELLLQLSTSIQDGADHSLGGAAAIGARDACPAEVGSALRHADADLVHGEVSGDLLQLHGQGLESLGVHALTDLETTVLQDDRTIRVYPEITSFGPLRRGELVARAHAIDAPLAISVRLVEGLGGSACHVEVRLGLQCLPSLDHAWSQVGFLELPGLLLRRSGHLLHDGLHDDGPFEITRSTHPSVARQVGDCTFAVELCVGNVVAVHAACLGETQHVEANVLQDVLLQAADLPAGDVIAAAPGGLEGGAGTQRPEVRRPVQLHHHGTLGAHCGHCCGSTNRREQHCLPTVGAADTLVLHGDLALRQVEDFAQHRLCPVQGLTGAVHHESTHAIWISIGRLGLQVEVLLTGRR